MDNTKERKIRKNRNIFAQDAWEKTAGTMRDRRKRRENESSRREIEDQLEDERYMNSVS